MAHETRHFQKSGTVSQLGNDKPNPGCQLIGGRVCCSDGGGAGRGLQEKDAGVTVRGGFMVCCDAGAVEPHSGGQET